MIRELIGALGACTPEVSADELADALWLAGHLRQGETRTGQPLPDPPPPDPGERSGPRTTEPPDLSGTETTGWPELPPRASAPVGLFMPSRRAASPALTRAPTVPAIPRMLPLARALRPLRRNARSRTRTELDEETTAQRIAETGVWQPELRHAPERRLDLALVVDDSTSMVVWRRTVVELRDLLEHLGAFRDIRVWRFDTDRDTPVLRAGSDARDSAVRSPRELIDPTGRRVILVLSDCIGRAWETGAAAQLLERWGRAGPIAILQPLPQRLWYRCAASFEPVRLRAAKAGTPNAELQVRLRDHGGAGELGVAVPVMEIEPRWLAPWAAMVGTGGQEITGVALLTGRPPAPAALHRPDTGELSPLERVSQFRATASPTAFQLASYLAATPVRMQVIRLVQSAMLPESRPAHLAEVYLGGLLRRADPTATDDPEHLEYDFHDGVRDVLLGGLRRTEALRVLRSVWEVVRGRLGSPLDFPAMLRALERGGDVELDRPFASVAWRVLRRLGGRYSEIAETLAETVRGAADPTGVVAVPPAPDAAESEPGTETGAPSGAATGDETGAETGVGSRTSAGTGGGTGPDGPVPIWGWVPPRNPNFTGRDELLRALRERLTEKTAALLPHARHGLGGVGKTQLAIEYAYRYAADYDLVWWIPAEQLSLARSSLAELGRRLGSSPSGDINRTVDNVLETLGGGRPYARWLLVYDNADDPEALRALMPAPSGHVLITSRDTRWSRHAATLEIGVFDRAESINLLRQRVPGISPGDADRLAAKLGDLPLAMEQAAAWQAEAGTSVREYLRLYERQIRRLRAEGLLDGSPYEEHLPDGAPPGDGPLDDHPPALAGTLGLAFERLRAESPAAGRLLELCAFFGSEPIALRMLTRGRGADLPAPVEETVSDRALLDQAVAAIGRYSLARIDRVHETVQVHRLVQTLLRVRLTEPEQATARREVHAVLAAANPDTTPGDESAFAQRAEIAPHIVPSGLIDGEGKEVRRVSLDQIRYLYVLGDYEESRRLGQMVLDRWRAKYGPDDEQTLVAGGYLANALRGLGAITDAADLNADIFERMRRTLGDDHPQTLATANSVGGDLRLKGEFTQARILDENTLDRLKRVLGPDEALTLRCANNLGIDYKLMGDFSRALELDEEIMHRYRKLLGNEHRDTIKAVNQTTRDLHGMGLYGRARERQENWLDYYRALLGSDHALVLEAALSHSVTLRKSGDYAQARQVAEEAFWLSYRRFGEDHHDTLLARTALAIDRVLAGDPVSGKVMAERALVGCLRIFGIDHPFVYMAAVHLGIILRALGEPVEARRRDEHTLANLRRLLGNDHYYTLCSATGLANDLYLLGEYGKAYELFGDTLNRSRRVRGEAHPYTLACAHNHAMTLEALGVAEAPALQESVLVRLRQVLGNSHPEVRAVASGKLAECDIQPTPP